MRRRQRGTASLEMVFAIPVLLLLLGAAIDFAFFGLVNHQLGYAARVASRWGITGQKPVSIDENVIPVKWCGAGATPTDTRVTFMRQLIAGSLGSILRADNVCIAVLSYTGGYSKIGDPEPYIDVNGNKAYDNGEPYTDINGDGSWSMDQGGASLGVGGDVTVYSLRYTTTQFSGLTPGLPEKLNFEARIVARNEPYLTK